MGTKYATNTASGYNSSPPADDGTATEANKVKWATVKTKLGDPVKDLADAINTDLVEHFDEGPITKATNYTVTAAENNQTIEVTGSTTITIPLASSVGAGFKVRIQNTDASNTTTVSRSGSDTLDGSTSFTLSQYDTIELTANTGEDGYIVRLAKNATLQGGAWEVKAANFNAAVGGKYLINTGAASYTATLPDSPADGTEIWFADHSADWGTNKADLARSGTDTIEGVATNFDLDVDNSIAVAVYNATTTDWRVY